MVENRQLSNVPLNFDCGRVWQWTVNLTAVAFGSESVKPFRLSIFKWPLKTCFTEVCLFLFKIFSSAS